MRTRPLAVAAAVALACAAVAPLAHADHTSAPGSVFLVGSLQSELGCSGDWDPACASTALTDTDVQFFMIDTETLDRTQLAWLDREMAKSEARWKIPVFHRPIYTSGRYAKPARIFRAALEPIFLRHDVRVGLSGHEHFYQRTTPQQGITYFISGGAGSLRRGDIRLQSLVAAGFDIDQHFMLFEVTRDELFYQAISRTGHSVDAGSISR